MLLVGVLWVLSNILGLGFFNFLGAVGGPGGAGGGSGIGEECPFLSDGEAREVLGGQADAVLLDGLAESMIGFIIDGRVLADAQDCWVTEGERAYIARVALHQGGDAGGRFAAEREAAQPVTVDQGGGLSTTREGYYGGAVEGLGDEAFCTGITGAFMGGVLVRQGDRLVYASVGPQEEGFSLGDLEVAEPDNAPVSSTLCALAQDLARAVLD